VQSSVPDEFYYNRMDEWSNIVLITEIEIELVKMVWSYIELLAFALVPLRSLMKSSNISV